jgi:hypothetical protein
MFSTHTTVNLPLEINISVIDLLSHIIWPKFAESLYISQLECSEAKYMAINKFIVYSNISYFNIHSIVCLK